MQAGNLDAGARLIRTAIKDENLSNNMRAVGYLWLAESQPNDINFRIECYNNALKFDPNNTDIQQRLSQLLAQRLPPDPSQRPATMPPYGGNRPLDDSQGMIPINLPSDSQPIRPLGDSQPININQPPPPQQGSSKPMPPINPDLQAYDSRLGTGAYPPVNPNQPVYDPRTGSVSYSPTNPNQPPVGPAQQGRYTLQKLYRVVGIRQGPNGMGTGVFVAQTGIVATTRYIVGGSERVQVELEPGQELPAEVVRTFPEFDLALLQVNANVTQLWTPTQLHTFPDNEQFIASSYNGKSQRGFKRQTKSALKPYWIPTSIQQANLPDAGGNGMFDSQNYLVGLLTRNASRQTGLLYGLHISQVYQCVRNYMQELTQINNPAYCTSCGSLSRAPHYGGFYCETCGGVLPGMENVRRFQQPNLEGLYGDNMHRPCPNCSSRAGYYESRCLRCGYDVSAGQRI